MMQPKQPTDEEIYDAIDRWHESSSTLPLYEFLGWSKAEFDTWLVDRSKAPTRPLKHSEPEIPYFLRRRDPATGRYEDGTI